MLAAASPTLPLSPSPALTSTPRRAWKPNGDAHLIYQWVKMEGKSQGWVAGAMNISQSTVSRIIQRYERWQAHAKEREDGRLDPAERLRAQRWQTFERNELILTSCLRIANEIEGFIDASKSTLSHPAHRPSQESEVRTEHFRVDRTGMTARFLRLAFKINMEQLKLAELTQPPLASPLSDDELAEEERQAAADDAELALARRRETPDEDDRRVGCVHHDAADEEVGAIDRAQDHAPANDPVGEAQPTTKSTPAADAGALPTIDSPTHHAPAPLHNTHNLHNENQPQIAASSTKPCSCGLEIEITKNSIDLCIIECDQPSWPSGEAPSIEDSPLATTQSP